MNILNWIYEIRSYASTYASRVKAWWLVALIWALVSAAVVFFYGDGLSFGRWRPFEKLETRLIAVGVIILGWVLYCIYRLITNRRRDNALIDAVTEGGAVDPARAAADDVARVRERLQEAMKLLRKTMGRSSVYALPWYALIGPPGSGKTTALQNSGLRFPLADSVGDSVEGVGGTRHCDWWFTDEAILIDTAGRYTAQEGDGEADAAGWRGFLKLLKKHRRRQPLNGAIVMLGLDTIMQGSASERLHHARVIRKRLRELDEAFGLRVPVYVVLTKADRLAGSSAFFDDMPRTGREQVWGATLPPPKSGIEGPDLADRFGKAFDALVARLNGLLLDRLQSETDAERRSEIFAFPSQIALIAEPLHEMLGEAAASSRFDPPPRIRGVYLASAQQGGTPLDLVTRAASQRFSLDLPRFGASTAGGAKSFFLARLFRDVIFGEANLVSTNPKLERRRLIIRRAAMGAAATIALGFCIAWSAAYLRQDRMLSETDSRLATYSAAAVTLPFEAVADTDFARADGVLASARDAVQPFTRDGTPDLLDAFDQEAKVTAGQTDLYGRALTHYLLPRILVAVGAELRAGDAQGADGSAQDNKAQDGKAQDGKATERKLQDKVAQRAAGKAPEIKLADQRAPDARALVGKAAEGRGQESANPTGKASGKAAEAQASEGTRIQENLRLYLMLGGEDSLDKAFASERIGALFGRLYAEEKQAPLRASLDGHVAAMLERPLIPIALDQSVVEGARGQATIRDLGARWRQAGEKACRSAVDRHYPFDKAATTDVTLADFVALFGPSGLFSTFFQANLQEAVDTEAKPWRWRSGGSGADAAALKSFENAAEIQAAFFPQGAAQAGIAFEVTPLSLDAVSTAVSLVSDGQEVAYSRGSMRPLKLTWPAQAPAAGAARVSFQPSAGEGLSQTGPWALFHLIDSGRAERPAPDRLRVAYEAAGRAATFEIRSVTTPNPFTLPALRTFRCPRIQ